MRGRVEHHQRFQDLQQPGSPLAMRATVSERVPADGDIDRPNIAAPILAVAEAGAGAELSSHQARRSGFDLQRTRAGQPSGGNRERGLISDDLTRLQTEGAMFG